MRLPAAFLLTALCSAQAPTPEAAVAAAARDAQTWLRADVFLYAKNLETGRAVGWRQDEKVRTASTIKLPILTALYDQVAKGKVRWDETLTLTKADTVSGSGVLSEFTPGARFSVRDVSNLMIVVSDNTATNLILGRITADAVNDYLDTIGLNQTRSLRKVRGDGTDLKQATGWSKAGLLKENERFGLGVSTSREMVQLIEMLAGGKIVSPAASKEILATMERQRYKDAIGRRLGDLPVASKSGGLDALRSDVALVTTPKARIAVAITVDGLKKIDYSADNEGQILIADLAKLIVEQLTR